MHPSVRHLSCNCISDLATSNFVGAKVTQCKGQWETFCVTKGQIMVFLVNVSPKPLDVAT